MCGQVNDETFEVNQYDAIYCGVGEGRGLCACALPARLAPRPPLSPPRSQVGGEDLFLSHKLPMTTTDNNTSTPLEIFKVGVSLLKNEDQDPTDPKLDVITELGDDLTGR
jgi:hypothetical protein